MSFKMPVRETKLGVLKANAYVKMLQLLILKKYQDGMTVPFMIILNHTYAGMDEKKSAKLPLFLLGDRDSSWKDYHKKKLPSGETQKQYTISGTCTKQGNALSLEIDASKGMNKVPQKTKGLINALLKKIDKNLALGGGEVDANDEEATPEVEGTKEKIVATAAAGNEAKPQKQASPEVKEQAKGEAEALSKAIKNVRTVFESSLKVVATNVKKGATSGKDIKLVKSANKAYDEFCKLHASSSAGVKKKFAGVHKSLTAKREELIKLSLAAKQTQKSLAQRMADTYFQTKANRTASEKEIKVFNTILKDTITYNKQSKFNKVAQKDLLRATSFLLKKVGVKQFKPELTDKVLEKIAA